MYVVSFADFMNMRSVQSHQELVSQGLLVEFQSQMGDAFFVSHQWTGSAHPDLKFEQLRVLQRAFDYLMGGQTLLKSTHMSYAMLGHGEYISTKDWHSHFMFIWYDYFSCPQLVSRSAEQAILPDLQNAVQSISSYVQKSKYFLVLVPSVHADTGELLSRESWQRRGWCRFERACREFLSEDANIAVIESVHRSYVMTPFDSWLKPACMGEFTVEGDRDKVEHQVSGMLHSKLISLLENANLHGFRMVLNLKHIYLRRSQPGQFSAKDPESCKLKLADFMKENGFEKLSERQCGWSPACFAALRGDPHVLKEMLDMRVDVDERVQANEQRYHIEKGMSLLSICAQFSNNSAMAMLIEMRANVNQQDSVVKGTPLLRAGMGNNAEGVQMLVQAGCNHCILDGFGHTALVPACAFGARDSARALLAAFPNIDRAKALHFAVVAEGQAELTIPELLGAGANINEKLQFTPGMRIQFRLLAKLAKWLDARHGRDLHFFLTNLMGATPLICSLASCNFSASAILIAAGADATMRNSAGNTALDVAQAVRAPNVVLRGLQGDTTACDHYVGPKIADRIWVSI
ncbi:unnamed protein product [Effrenium voratum]|uniref:Uncharacterized protein n=1 Tax=Effrenium voratum TaxID=2562239 RepID=A0AA36JG63_9DINO|nr:unnamed protein product [Effrenium voratum]